MKVAYIGGLNDANQYDNSGYGDHVYKPKITINEKRSGFQVSVGDPKKDDYILTLLKYQGEFKYFYVLKGMEKSEIRTLIPKYWELADVIGYDLD
ncbi:hypothetical protein [Acinetobacter dispersus]|uniref:hypothetical protein n=1 Tax=Acinetobacter dispersus TaxID=70348 RepID=UPI001F4AE7BA|nr:hypothetical protein [Acinetobacter dispersus]MCH7389545.1 hypothetical protein [Acinetobacter dispersus]